MKTLAFNTGRTYTPQGQRIAAALLSNGNIVFNDIDRTICGTIDAGGLTIDEVIALNCFTQRAIMEDYDANRYTDTMNQELRAKLHDLAAAL